MKLIKHLFAILLFAAPAFAQNQGAAFGTPMVAGSSSLASDRAMSSTSIFDAMGFLPLQSKTITEISIYVTSVSGSGWGSTDGRLDIYSSTSAGAPNASLVNVTFDASTSGWKRLTFSQAV